MRAAFFVTAAVLLLAALPLQAQECNEEVLFETADGTIVMRHAEARFNCCAWLEIEVVQNGCEIGIFEWEQFDSGPCYCLCCFAVETSISGLTPGDHSVSVWKVHDNFDGTWTHELVGTWIVSVTGYSASGVDSSYLPCVNTGAADEEVTWATIKALFRREVPR